MLIVAGTLVGASGMLLTRMMSQAMGRSLPNILFSAFGSVVTADWRRGSGPTGGRCGAATAEDIGVLLAYARKVAIVPGYGLAVAQAQHVVRELADAARARGVEVYYAIHPVAGRMPGHMNVLLAEANVPYEQLKEMDEANPEIATTDVALVVGANDTVNPAAREHAGKPDLRHADHQRRRGHRTSSSSSARCGRASPASTTSCSTTPRRPCSSGTPRTRLTKLDAAVVDARPRSGPRSGPEAQGLGPGQWGRSHSDPDLPTI